MGNVLRRRRLRILPRLGASAGRPTYALACAKVTAAVAACLLAATAAEAACDLIPGVSASFRGALGSVNRPFSSPGEIVDLRLSGVCDAASRGFAAAAEDHVVTLIFTPPAASRHIVVISADCARLDGERLACESRDDVARAVCLDIGTAGRAPLVEVLEVRGERRLRVRFPDTDPLVGELDDGRTLAGPVKIVVTRTGDALPCGLASATCDDGSGLVACIDTLYELDGTCRGPVHSTIDHFVALPPPNDYRALCVDPAPPCNGSAAEIRLTTDVQGNLLLPMDWRGILVDSGVPIPRLLRGTSTVEAFPGGGQPIRIPDATFLASLSNQGTRLPPIFDPQFDPTESARQLTLFGSADAPQTVLRIARRSPTGFACEAGPNEGLPCERLADCPQSECVQATTLFDFSTRFDAGVGPVLVSRRQGSGTCQNAGTPCASDADCNGPCVSYRLEAQNPVPLDGLIESNELFAFVVAEGIEAEDLNGDGDTTDDVVLPTLRRTGEVRSLAAAAAGRAVTRVLEPPFSFPAVDVEGDLLAFLESEPAQGGVDANGDGDVFDSILRLFRIGQEATLELGTDNLAADVDPVIDGRPLAISQGRVFFRAREAAQARLVSSEIDLPFGLDFALNHDAGVVAFSSSADDLVQGDNNNAADVFVYDRPSDTVERVSVSTAGGEADRQSSGSAISADGRYVAFVSEATNLVDGDTNELSDVFLRDRVRGTTERVSVGGAFCATGTRRGSPCAAATDCPGSSCADGEEADGESGDIAISADGQVIAFVSSARNLVLNDLNHRPDIFVYERSTRQTHRVSVATNGAQSLTGEFESRDPALSADGSIVVFTSSASDLVVGDRNLTDDIFLHDRQRRTTERVSIGTAGEEADASSRGPQVDADGRFVAFASNASNLAVNEGGQPGTPVYLRDREKGVTRRFGTVSSQLSGAALFLEHIIDTLTGYGLSLSADGRFLLTRSLLDRLTGYSMPIPRRPGFLSWPRLSGNGRTILVASLEDPDLLAPPPLTYVADLLEPETRDECTTRARCDLNDDGDLTDVVLMAVDTQTVGSAPIALGPAAAVAVFQGSAVFLVPEAMAAGADLNDDGDTDDTVVHLSRATEPLGPGENLGLAATEAVVSDGWVAAAASEAQEGGADLNGDGDTQDAVLHVRALDAERWTNVGEAASALAVRGRFVAFITNEAEQGGRDLNGDGDAADRVLRLYDSVDGSLLPLDRQAEEFVLRDRLLAFRVSESADGRGDLNGDGDIRDDVLFVYDLLERRLVNSGQAVLPCRLEACDPRVPYRVRNHTVTFLTLESDQGGLDLNGDGDGGDLVLQSLNLPMAIAMLDPESAARSSRPRPLGRTRRLLGVVQAAPLTTLAAIGAGVCTTTGDGCATAADCEGGVCFIPPGGCIENTGVCCDTDPSDAREACGDQEASCADGEFCLPRSGFRGTGTCNKVGGSCRSDTDCGPQARCNDAGLNFQRLSAPLNAATSGAELFTAIGRCVDTTALPCGAEDACAAGEACGPLGLCERSAGTCDTDEDCGDGLLCRRDLVVATAADQDGDEIADPFDNCANVANPAQEDRDRDGTGDACEPGAPAPPTATARQPRTPTLPFPPTSTATPPSPAPATSTPPASPTAPTPPSTLSPSPTPTPTPGRTSTPTPSPTSVTVCPADQDPCLIDSVVTLESDSLIDVRPRGFRVTSKGKLRADALHLRAAALEIEAGGEIEALEPLSGPHSVSLAVASAEIHGTITARGEVGGEVTVLAPGGSISVTGTIDVRDKGDRFGGGSVELNARTITIDGDIRAEGLDGGSVFVDADHALIVRGTIDASGKEYGGDIFLSSNGEVRLDPESRLHVDAASFSPTAGGISILFGSVQEPASLALGGVLSATASAFGDGGDVDVFGDGPVTSSSTCHIDVGAGRDGSGGRVDFLIDDLDLVCSIDANAAGKESSGGRIDVFASNSATLHSRLRANAGDGGDVSLRVGHTLIVSPEGRIEAKSDGGSSGAISLSKQSAEPASGLLLVDGTLDASGGRAFSGNSTIDIDALGDISIRGAVYADGLSTTSSGGFINITAQDGSVSLEGPLFVRGRRDGVGGTVAISADGEVIVAAGVDASAADAAGGMVAISAGGEVTVGATVDASATAGNGGMVAISAGGEVTVGATVDASTTTGDGGIIGVRTLGGIVLDQPLLAAGKRGSGGRIELASRGRVVIRNEVRSDGAAGRKGGRIVAEACDLDLAPTGVLSSAGASGLNRVFGRSSSQIRGQMQADSASGRNELIVGDGSGAPVRSDTAVVIPEPITRPLLGVRSCAVCGDRRIEFPEACDDGNSQDGDGCSALCRIESAPTPTPSVTPSPTSAPTVPMPTLTAAPSPSPTATSAPTSAFDHNGDGCVSAADITALLREVTGGAIDPREISATIVAIFSGC